MRKGIGVLFVMGAALLLGADPAGFAFWSASDLKGMDKKLAPKMDPKVKVATAQLGTYGNHGFMMVYREADGEAELHQTQVDVFVVQNGEAELVLGGEMIGGKTTAPGEIRGPSIKGGRRMKLAPGDIAHIPAMVPHQVLVRPGTKFTYAIVKVNAK
jgi:mannose-6-phosphate isomerase-like protein (cupin superfamily)